MKKKPVNFLNKNKAIIIAIMILILLVSLFLVFHNAGVVKTGNKNVISDESFFSDNKCACLERNRNKCSDGFELKGNLCVNETLKTYTNVIRGCSKYACNSTFYTFNFKNENWEN